VNDPGLARATWSRARLGSFTPRFLVSVSCTALRPLFPRLITIRSTIRSDRVRIQAMSRERSRG
jgi:hypothetical protein